MHQNHSLTGNGRLINSINCEWLDVEYIICADDQINPNYVERLVAHALVPCFRPLLHAFPAPTCLESRGNVIAIGLRGAQPHSDQIIKMPPFMRPFI